VVSVVAGTWGDNPYSLSITLLANTTLRTGRMRRVTGTRTPPRLCVFHLKAPRVGMGGRSGSFVNALVGGHPGMTCMLSLRRGRVGGIPFWPSQASDAMHLTGLCRRSPAGWMLKNKPVKPMYLYLVSGYFPFRFLTCVALQGWRVGVDDK